MAINAKFQADFSGFLEAVDKAELALVDMSKGASKVEGSLNRMVDNFSGRKLIQEVALMTVAIEKAGGISTLTAAQLEVVGNKAAEAAEKMKALGYAVPAGMQKLADATKDVSTQTQGFASSLNSVQTALGALGIGFGISQVISFGKEIINDADSLDKLSDRTDISVEALQRMRLAGDDAGVTIETLAAATNKLQKNLAEGSPNTVSAVEDLGLKLQDLRAMNADERLAAISDAVKQMHDPLRVAGDLSALFGKTWGELLPVLKRGFAEVSDGTKVMSKDTVTALDTMGDAWTRNARKAEVAVAEGFVAAFGGFGAADREAKRDADDLAESLRKMAKTATETAPTFGALVPPEVPAKLKAIEDGLDGDTRAANEFRRIVAEMDKSTFQLAMDHAKQWREETAKLLAERNKSVVDGLNQIKNAEADLADFEAKQSLSSTDYQIKKIWDVVREQEAAFKGTEDQRKQFNAAIEKLAQEHTDALRKQARDAAAEGANDAESASSAFQDWADMVDVTTASLQLTSEATAALSGDLNSLAKSIETLAGEWITAADAKKRFDQGGSIDINQAARDPEINSLLHEGWSFENAIKIWMSRHNGNYPITLYSPTGSTETTPSPGERVPGYAGGVHRAPGGWAMVGERGPELVRLPKGASVIPNNQIGGGGVVNVYVTQPLGTPTQIARAVNEAQTKSLKSQGFRFKVGG